MSEISHRRELCYLQTDSFVTETSGKMCNACLHPSNASCRTVTHRSFISHVVLFKMLVEVQDCKGVATPGKLPQKSRKERRTKAEDIGRCCEERIRGQSAPCVSILSSGSNSCAVLSRCVLSPAWLCLRDAILRTIPLPGSCQRLGERASPAHLCSSLISQILQRSFFSTFSSPQTWIISKSTPGARCQSERDRGWCCCAERRHPREVSSLGLQRSLLLKMLSA